MKRFTLGLGVVVAGLALTASPALAQRPGGSSGARTGGGGNSGGGGGTAVSRSAPPSASAPSSSAPSAPSASTSAPSARVAMAPSMSGASAAAPRQAAPQHRATGWQSTARSAGSPHTMTGYAVPRNESAAGSGVRTPNNPNAADAGAVPPWARSRGTTPATDTAVPRTTPHPTPGQGLPSVFFYPGYSVCYGCGIGGFYDYYDPFFGAIYPPMFGYGMGLGLGAYPMFDPSVGYGSGDPYNYGVGSYSSSQYSASHEDGNLKLKVKPRSAKVYVDGYYVGIVDEFDGAFQKLPLTAGRHHVKIEADGYESAEFDAVITADKTVTFQGDLKKIQ